MVFAGNFRLGSTEHGLAAGFRDDGWNVHEIDIRTYVGFSVSFTDRLVSRLERKDRLAAYRAEIEAVCELLRPDVLFSVKGRGLNADLFNRARRIGVRAIILWPDYHFDYPDIDVNALLQSDLFITTKSFQMSWLAERGLASRSAFVAHGYDPSCHTPTLGTIAEDGYTADVRYIGNHSVSKQEWVQWLGSTLPEIRFCVAGGGWHESLSQPIAKRIVETDGYFGLAYSRAIQTARINVAFHMGKAPNGWEDHVSTRSFEIPACGGFMLHIDNDEVREYYDVGTEIDVFSSKEELADKCRYYLANDDIRRRMAKNAHERCVPAYSYTARANEISDALAVFGLLKDSDSRGS
jgi:spore maturation protein CgeB